MKAVAHLTILLLVCTCGVVAQRAHRNPTPLEDKEASPDRPQLVQHVDPAQIKRDANDLADLASTVPADVARASNGILAKDLKDKLKRIEKLSKRLRSELALQ